MKTALRFLLAFLSGGLAVFAFPPFGWVPVVIFAWPLLFLSLRGAGFKTGTRLGVLHGLMLYGITLSWLWNIFGTLAIALCFMLAIFTGLAGGLIGWSGKRHPQAWWLPFYVAAAWSGIEYFRCEWFWLRFPWMTPGMALGPTPLSPFIGVYGASFLVILAAALLVFSRRGWRFAGVIPVVILMGMPFTSMHQPGTEVPVLAVQNENSDFYRCLDATKASDIRDGIVVWPEYAVSEDITPSAGSAVDAGKSSAEARIHAAMFGAIRNLATERNATVVFGSIKELGNEKHYNIARVIDATGELGWHPKNRPVHFMNDGERGTTAVPIKTPYGSLGTPICFDCDYTEVLRRMAAAGAEAFVIPSMDVKKWSAREHLQHAEVFRHRAAENGRWIVVAASSGRTQIIDPQGNVVKSLPLMDEGTLRGSIRLRTEQTFFTRIGWTVPWIILSSAIAATIALMLVRPPVFPVTPRKDVQGV